jgi:hypothetical protein
MLIPKAVCGFLHRAAIIQEFLGTLLTLLHQPRFGGFPHVLQKMPFQHEHGGADPFGHCGNRPMDFFSKLLPVLDTIQMSAHDFQFGRSNVIALAQCGQLIFCPTACGGNSTWPPHRTQVIFKFSSGRCRMTVARQWGQGICWTMFWAANLTCPPPIRRLGINAEWLRADWRSITPPPQPLESLLPTA